MNGFAFDRQSIIRQGIAMSRGFGVAGRAVRWTKVWDTLVEVSDCQVYLQSFTFGGWIEGNDRLSSTRI